MDSENQNNRRKENFSVVWFFSKSKAREKRAWDKLAFDGWKSVRVGEWKQLFCAVLEINWPLTSHTNYCLSHIFLFCYHVCYAVRFLLMSGRAFFIFWKITDSSSFLLSQHQWMKNSFLIKVCVKNCLLNEWKLQLGLQIFGLPHLLPPTSDWVYM